jgi:hypothetical protein
VTTSATSSYSSGPVRAAAAGRDDRGGRAQRAAVGIARAAERLLVPPSRRIPVPRAAPVAGPRSTPSARCAATWSRSWRGGRGGDPRAARGYRAHAPARPGRPAVGALALARTEERGGTSRSWTIERRGRVAVVTMTTNPVNAQNRRPAPGVRPARTRSRRLARRADRHRQAVLRRPHLGEHFPLCADDPAAVASWFGDYRATNMRLFTYPRPTVAAVNGHALRWRPHHRRRV